MRKAGGYGTPRNTFHRIFELENIFNIQRSPRSRRGGNKKAAGNGTHTPVVFRARITTEWGME